MPDKSFKPLDIGPTYDFPDILFEKVKTRSDNFPC